MIKEKQLKKRILPAQWLCNKLCHNFASQSFKNIFDGLELKKKKTLTEKKLSES